MNEIFISERKMKRNSQGQLHNEEGPAWISTDGYEAWFINGGQHREDGPACFYQNLKGHNAIIFCINGIKIE